MQVSDQLQKAGLFFADYGFVPVLEYMAVSFIPISGRGTISERILDNVPG